MSAFFQTEIQSFSEVAVDQEIKQPERILSQRHKSRSEFDLMATNTKSRDGLFTRSSTQRDLMVTQRSSPQFNVMDKQQSEGFRTDSIETEVHDIDPSLVIRPSFNSERASEMPVGTDSDRQSIEGTSPFGSGLQICGYLLKKSKEGAWQRRFFETNGTFLTYYKSKNKTKLLAALNLADVSEISVVHQCADVFLVYWLIPTNSYSLRRAKLMICSVLDLYFSWT